MSDVDAHTAAHSARTPPGPMRGLSASEREVSAVEQAQSGSSSLCGHPGLHVSVVRPRRWLRASVMCPEAREAKARAGAHGGRRGAGRRLHGALRERARLEGERVEPRVILRDGRRGLSVAARPLLFPLPRVLREPKP